MQRLYVRFSNVWFANGVLGAIVQTNVMAANSCGESFKRAECLAAGWPRCRELPFSVVRPIRSMRDQCYTG